MQEESAARPESREKSIIVTIMKVWPGHSTLQDKEQALLSISDNAREHMRRSKEKRAHIYDNLLREYRYRTFTFVLH